jgi:hypothetical protein
MKVSYANMKLKVNNEVKTFDFNGTEIEVLSYLPIEDKFDLVMITLQESLVNNIYNSIQLEMHFNLNLAYMYTNISFTDKQKEDEAKLYDTLKTNGFFDKLVETIDDDEYAELLGYIEEEIEKSMRYNTSAAAIIRSLVDDLPTQAQAAMDIVNNFDKDKFQEVVAFAQAANGGRPIE